MLRYTMKCVEAGNKGPAGPLIAAANDVGSGTTGSSDESSEDSAK